jgi:DNA-directed RNA polymerase specialized sigma24 family protein
MLIKKRRKKRMTHAQLIRFLRCPSSELVDFALTLANLDKKEAAVIDLCGRKAYTQEEAAEILDRSPDAIQKWWHSGTIKLKAAWSGRWWIEKILT